MRPLTPSPACSLRQSSSNQRANGNTGRGDSKDDANEFWQHRERSGQPLRGTSCREKGERSLGLDSIGTAAATMTRAPFKMPAPPAPATALPAMNMREDVAAPQIKDPTTNIMKAPMKISFEAMTQRLSSGRWCHIRTHLGVVEFIHLSKQ